MREEDLQREIIRMCKELGLLVHHAPDSRRGSGTAGFPDLVITSDDCTIFAELKSKDGRLQPGQKTWITTLRKAGQIVYLWRPVDLDSGYIERVLRSIA